MHFKEFVSVVKARRDALQITQDVLAELSGVSLRALKQFESGKGNPTLGTLQKIGNVLGLELSWEVRNLNREE